MPHTDTDKMEEHLNGVRGQVLALQQLNISHVENILILTAYPHPPDERGLPFPIITFIALFKSWGFNFPSHQNGSAFNSPRPFSLLFCSPRLAHPRHIRAISPEQRAARTPRSWVVTDL